MRIATRKSREFRKIEIKAGPPGREFDCFLTRDFRLLKPADLQKGSPHAVVGLSKIWLNRQRPFKAGNCFLLAVECAEDHAAVIERFGIVRPDRKRRIMARQRL